MNSACIVSTVRYTLNLPLLKRVLIAVTLMNLAGIQAAVSRSEKLRVISVAPASNSIPSDLRPRITVRFNQAIDAVSATGDNLIVAGERSGTMNGVIAYDSVAHEMSFSVSNDFLAGEAVTVDLTRNIHTAAYDSLSGYIWCFRTPVIHATTARFQTPVQYTGGGYSMQCADMNGDRFPDIVTSAGAILLNNGSGQFISSWTLGNSYNYGKIAVADFNRDGAMDVVYEGGSTGFVVGLGDGKGNFSQQIVPYYLGNFMPADINHDGYPDIIGCQPSGIQTYVIAAMNDGRGHFADSSHLAAVDGLFKDCAVCDIDNDGDLDILCLSQHVMRPDSLYGFEGLVYMINEGEGKFSAPQFYTSPKVNQAFPEHLLTADFNNDGYTDIAVMADMEGFVCLNLKDGRFGTDTSSMRSVWGAEAVAPFALGDLNGDNWLDLVVSGWRISFDSSRTRFFSVIQNGPSVFSAAPPRMDTVGYNTSIKAVQAVDIDGDGDLDLVHVGNDVRVSINEDRSASVSEQQAAVSETCMLFNNYPNPFNPSTRIDFSLPSRSFVTLKVFDLLGREITTLAAEEMSAGIYSRTWNASGFPSGMYFYRLQAGSYTETKRLMLVK